MKEGGRWELKLIDWPLREGEGEECVKTKEERARLDGANSHEDS